MPGNCVSVRKRGEQPVARQAACIEGEPHQMSLEKPQIVEPSRLKPGEGCQDWAKVNPVENGRDLNDDMSSHRHDVVCGGGMPDKVGVLTEEIWPGGWQRPTAGASGQSREARSARTEVGAAHSREEAANHRGSKGPHLVNANCEARDRR
jgi:hypothetical protein